MSFFQVNASSSFFNFCFYLTVRRTYKQTNIVQYALFCFPFHIKIIRGIQFEKPNSLLTLQSSSSNV